MKLSQVKTDKAIWKKKMKNERIFALELICSNLKGNDVVTGIDKLTNRRKQREW